MAMPTVTVRRTEHEGSDLGLDAESPVPAPVIFEVRDVAVSYSGQVAVEQVTFDVRRHDITALAGPPGCGKSTLLRSLNRMNDFIPGAELSGSISYHGDDLYGSDVDPVEVRRRIGMVFPRPNPFPKSIYDNVAFGPRINGHRKDLDEIVERALTSAALWDEVKAKLREPAFALSSGQQQRLCIARCLAVEPEVILMDEPCRSLDPIATARIEDLMAALKRDYTIVIVTHNMQQAARVSDKTAFMTAEIDDAGYRVGRLVEFDTTPKLFAESYSAGRFA
jgi:phosphate transport system ATP-binding protein